MSDEESSSQSSRVIHLGTMSVKGPGTFIGGVVKFRSDPESDLLETARSFLSAADRSLNGSRDVPGVEHLTVPGAVCGALACELFFKYILLREGMTPPRKHKLDTLFGLLSADTQAELARTIPDLTDILERNANHFVEGRYHFEQPEFSFRQQELLQTAQRISAFVDSRFPLAKDEPGGGAQREGDENLTPPDATGH